MIVVERIVHAVWRRPAIGEKNQNGNRADTRGGNRNIAPAACEAAPGHRVTSKPSQHQQRQRGDEPHAQRRNPRPRQTARGRRHDEGKDSQRQTQLDNQVQPADRHPVVPRLQPAGQKKKASGKYGCKDNCGTGADKGERENILQQKKPGRCDGQCDPAKHSQQRCGNGIANRDTEIGTSSAYTGVPDQAGDQQQTDQQDGEPDQTEIGNIRQRRERLAQHLLRAPEHRRQTAVDQVFPKSRNRSGVARYARPDLRNAKIGGQRACCHQPDKQEIKALSGTGKGQLANHECRMRLGCGRHLCDSKCGDCRTDTERRGAFPPMESGLSLIIGHRHSGQEPWRLILGTIPSATIPVIVSSSSGSTLNIAASMILCRDFRSFW